MYRSKILAFTLLIGISFSGCGTAKVSARAEEGRPDSAKVEQVSIPYDAKLPRFVVTVQPFVAQTADVYTFTQGETNSVPLGEKLAAQMTTALAKVGNFSIASQKSVKAGKDGTYSVKMKKGEVGPFVLKATVTEFNETAEANASERGGSLGWAGGIMGIAGAITGNRALTYTGAGIAAANPTYNEQKASRKGVVAFDVEVLDGRNGRLVTSFSSAGTFVAESASSGISLFGIGGKDAAFASSAMGQALRAALNDTVKQSFEALQSQR